MALSQATLCNHTILYQEKKKILLVEDEPINQDLGRILLEKEGYKVDVAENGREAIQRYCSMAYNLILMDINLPDMLGTEVTEIIRKIETSSGRYTPIIALTGNSQVAKESCLEAGMNDFSYKPFKAEALKNMISFYTTPILHSNGASL